MFIAGLDRRKLFGNLAFNTVGPLANLLDDGLPQGQLSDHGSTIGLSPQTPNFTQNDDARCVAGHTSQKGATLEITTQFEAVKISDRAPVESRQPRHVHCGGQSMIYCDRYHYHQYTDHRFSSFLSWLGEEIEEIFHHC